MMLKCKINDCITYHGDFRDRSAVNAYEVAVVTRVCQPLENNAQSFSAVTDCSFFTLYFVRKAKNINQERNVVFFETKICLTLSLTFILQCKSFNKDTLDVSPC